VKIDAHLHLNLHGLDEERLLRRLDERGVDRAWVMTWDEAAPGAWPYRPLPAEAVLRLAERHPERIVPMVAPDPQRADAVERLAAAHRRGAQGLAELKTTCRWTDPEPARLLAAAGELGMPVVFHSEAAEERLRDPARSGRRQRLLLRLYRSERLPKLLRRWVRRLLGPGRPLRRHIAYAFPGYLPDLERLRPVLAAHPGTAFVAHGPQIWQNWQSGDAGAAPVPGLAGPDWPANLFLDLSGPTALRALRRQPDRARRLLVEHADRILYGTDNIAGLDALLDALDLPDAAREPILGGNAAALLAGEQP
jgi:predicted TIM-barrel fold metal-dependent hydrolase